MKQLVASLDSTAPCCQEPCRGAAGGRLDSSKWTTGMPAPTETPAYRPARQQMLTWRCPTAPVTSANFDTQQVMALRGKRRCGSSPPFRLLLALTQQCFYCLLHGLMLEQHCTCRDDNRWPMPPIMSETRPLCRRALLHLCSTAQTAEQQSLRFNVPSPAAATPHDLCGKENFLLPFDARQLGPTRYEPRYCKESTQQSLQLVQKQLL